MPRLGHFASVRGLWVALVLVLALAGCVNSDPLSSRVPEISLISLEREFPRSGYAPNEVQRSDVPTAREGLLLKFRFTDGDGDIGGIPGGPFTFICRDIRPERPGAFPYEVTLMSGTSIVQETYLSGHLPTIASDNRNPSVEGEVVLSIQTLEALPLDTCVFTPNAPGFRQRVRFEFYILDKAGNRSNIITTPEVIVRCQ